MKKCKCCLKKKALKSFSKNKKMVDGLAFYCKECANAKAKKYREANYAHYLEKEKEYRIKNIDKIAAYQDEYYSRPDIKEKTKEYFKKYREENREALNKYAQEYAQKNCELKRKVNLEYYYENREAILKKKKEQRGPYKRGPYKSSALTQKVYLKPS